MNLMGRAKILWSHTRDMRVDVSKGLIKYSIPTGNEVLGDFVKAEKKGDRVVIYYRNTPALSEPTDVKIDTAAREPILPDPFRMSF
jgi:hypothetical protein